MQAFTERLSATQLGDWDAAQVLARHKGVRGLPSNQELLPAC